MNTPFTGLASRVCFANLFPSFLIMNARQQSRAVAAGAFALLLLLGASRPSLAQNVIFVGTQTTVPAIGLHCPRGVAVSQAGNVFIADNNDDRVLVVPAGGGAQYTVGSGLSGPNGVTVDQHGNVFIADSRHNRVVVVPANGKPQYTVGKGLHTPGGVAVDAAGNVFIADTRNNRVVVVPANGKPQGTVGDGLSADRDVALDAARDVFIADTGNNRVVVVPAGGGDQYAIGTGLNYPSGVVVDKAGNVFISDPGNQRVVEVPAGGGAQTTLPTSGLVYPYGVAVDTTGDVFIVDHAIIDGNCPQDGGSSKVVEWQRETVNFGSVDMQSSTTLTLNYAVAATTTFGPVEVQSQGDFTLSGGNTCSGTLRAGSACVVNIAFAPQARGLRKGDIELTDSSGNALVTTSVQGNGVAATEAKLSSSPNPSTYGEAVTFTAAVTSDDGSPPDGETVSFVKGTTILGTGTLKGGSASFTISTLPVGKTKVTAVYGGDSEFSESTSNLVLQVVKDAGE